MQKRFGTIVMAAVLSSPVASQARTLLGNPEKTMGLGRAAMGTFESATGKSPRASIHSGVGRGGRV